MGIEMKMKVEVKGLFVAALLLLSAAAVAENVQWKKNFGGSGDDFYNFVAAVSDGVVVVGSSTAFGSGDWAGVAGKGAEDAIIVKYDNAGNVVWKKNFGGGGGDCYYFVAAVSDGVIAVGRSYGDSFGSGDWTGVTGKGEEDAIIVKYDNAGNVVWKKNFGGSGFDRYYSVMAVSDGVIATGFSDGFGSGDWAGVTGKGSEDAIIVKYDPDGNVVWKKNFGGGSYDRYLSVAAVSDGVIAAGYSNAFGAGDWEDTKGNIGDDAIVVKYDFDGAVQWKKNFGGRGNDFHGTVTAVADGIVAVGHSTVFNSSFAAGDWTGVEGKGEEDVTIVKYDLAGNVVWKKNFGGSSSDFGRSVAAVSDGVIVVGYSLPNSFGSGDWAGVEGKGINDAIIVKYDLNGTLQWKKNFGGGSNDIYASVAAVSDGVVVVGYSAGFGSGDWTGVTGKGDWGWDATVVKYLSDGSKIPGAAAAPDFKVYPNPVRDELFIESPQPVESVTIFDLSGRSLAVKNGAQSFPVSHLPAGLYFVKAGNYIAKFVKE
jgi:hypothetical protein